MPAFKLGRWDGTKTYFSIGGTGYLAHLDVILPIIHSDGYEIEVEDNRKPIDLKFQPITESYWADQGKVWPVGHRFAGEPIILRDDQANAVNMFLDNPQSLQSISTGAGKTITVATLSQLCEPYGRSMIIVPSKDLVLQTEEDYKNVGLDVGVYYGDRKEIDRTHTICTWQSLDALDKKNPDQSILSLAELIDGVTTVIVDECFDGDARVLTSDRGYIPIKEIKSGDSIINYSEETKEFKVDTVVKTHTNIEKSNNEKMYELEFDNAATIKVTGNHKFLTTVGWVRADELTGTHDIISKPYIV